MRKNFSMMRRTTLENKKLTEQEVLQGKAQKIMNTIARKAADTSLY